MGRSADIAAGGESKEHGQGQVRSVQTQQLEAFTVRSMGVTGAQTQHLGFMARSMGMGRCTADTAAGGVCPPACFRGDSDGSPYMYGLEGACV